MSKRKRTPEEREELERLIESGREARRHMQEILDRVEARRQRRIWPFARRDP